MIVIAFVSTSVITFVTGFVIAVILGERNEVKQCKENRQIGFVYQQ